MSEIPYVVDVDTYQVKVVRWPDMANGDTGKPYPLAAKYLGKTVEVTGTYGAGGTAAIKGTSQFADVALLTQPLAAAFQTLRDPNDTALEIVAADPQIEIVRESPYWVMPEITAGDITTALTVIMTLVG